MIGGHFIKVWRSTQPSVSLSSGEAGMVRVTKAAAAAIGFRSLLADLGVKWPIRVWTDSSASIGMCSRQGIGKVRHMDTQVMWIQQRVRNNDLDLCKVSGEQHPADVLTKPDIPKDRMEALLEMMGCTFEGGRAQSAPTLRTEGGGKVFATLQGRGACRHDRNVGFPKNKGRLSGDGSQAGEPSEVLSKEGRPSGDGNPAGEPENGAEKEATKVLETRTGSNHFIKKMINDQIPLQFYSIWRRVRGALF